MKGVILFVTTVSAWASIAAGLMAFGLGASPESVARLMALAAGVSAWLVGLAVLEAGAEAAE